MCSPLKNETQVPKNEEKDDRGSSDKRAILGTEDPGKALKQESQAENKDRRERNKKAISKRGHPVPIGITGNHVVKTCGRKGKKQCNGPGCARCEAQSRDRKT